MPRSKLRRSLPLMLSIVLPGMAIAAALPRVATKLPPPEHVNAETRATLQAKMGFHAKTMSSLVEAVIVLDRPAIRVLATRIADTEVVAHAEAVSAAKGSLALPKEFFVEQTQLADAARRLAAAASGEGDDAALADRFAAVTRTCVSCHSIYLHGVPTSTTPPPASTNPSPRL